MENNNVDRLNNLTWWDLFLLTTIMFSPFIYSSLIGYISLKDKQYGGVLEFTSDANWSNLVFQAILLAIAMLYLRLRNFNFSQWSISINLKAIVQGIGIFLVVSLTIDLFFIAASYINPLGETAYSISDTNIRPNIDLSLLLYSVLNGFYEEIFFLGICLAVAKDKRLLVILYALFVRYIFHTYQGQVAAVAIGLIVGISYYFLYTIIRPKNLFPFFLAHALADIF